MGSNLNESTHLAYQQREEKEPQTGSSLEDVKGFKDTVYWVKRAVEMEKLLRSLKKSKILLDQVKRQLISKDGAKHSGHKDAKWSSPEAPNGGYQLILFVVSESWNIWWKKNGFDN